MDSKHKYKDQRRQTLPNISLGQNSFAEKQAVVSALAPSTSLAVSECSPKTSFKREVQVKYHTLDEISLKRELDTEDKADSKRDLRMPNKCNLNVSSLYMRFI